MHHKGSPLDLPCVDLGTFMTETFDLYGDKIALADATSPRVMTYRDLASNIRRLARGLSNLGFKKGDVLCIFLPNVLEYPVVFYAVASLGGILQATNPMYNASELSHTFDISGTSYVLTQPQMLHTVKQADKGRIKKTIILGDAPGCVSYSSLVSPEISNGPIINRSINPKQDVVAILFSSGTTGKPKGAQITHYAIVSNVLQMLSTGELTERDVYVTFLPLFHIYGLSPLITVSLYSGAKSVIVSRFMPQEYLENVQKHRATVLHVVPPVMVLLSKMPGFDKYDVSSVRLIICGAAPLSQDVEAKIIKMFNIDHIGQGYGMTECGVTHFSFADEHKFGSVGRTIPAAECKIVDVETEAVLPINVDGEVWVRCPSLMKGYISNPGANAAMFAGGGWLRTGDIGHVDEEGFLFIVDRLKELIKYKGFQVAPAELEDILLSHPSVADVGVIGIPDEEAGELPKAFVVRKSGTNMSERELQEFVASKVSGTKRLRGGVTFIPEIPKSVSGKILRRMLRDMETQKKSKL